MKDKYYFIKNFTLLISAALGTLILILTSVAFASDVFPDVSDQHQNSKAITDLKEREILSGAEDGNFYPARPVSRVELLKIAFLSSGVQPSLDPTLLNSDVDPDSWYAMFVSEAVKRGIATGYPDGLFRPNQTVTKVEAIKILFNSHSINPPTKNIIQVYLDIPPGEWYTPYVLFATSKNLIEVTSEMFGRDELMLRKDIAEITYRLLAVNEQNLEHFYDFDPQKTTPLPGNISNNSFKDIVLERSLPRNFVMGEVYRLKGSSTKDNSKDVSAYLIDGATYNNKQLIGKNELENGQFEISIIMSDPGNYMIGIFPGTNGKEFKEKIVVLPEANNPTQEFSSKPSNLKIDLTENNTIFKWNNSGCNLSKLTFSQGNTSITHIISNDHNEWEADYSDFTYFEPGNITWKVACSKSSDGSAYNQSSRWSQEVSDSFKASTHHFSIIEDDQILIKNPFPYYVKSNDKLTIRATALRDLLPDAKIIRPDSYTIDTISLSSNNLIQVNEDFNVEFTLDNPGTYILEVNDPDGFAVINSPIYVDGDIPLIPDIENIKSYNLSSNQLTLSNSELNLRRNLLLDLINSARQNTGSPYVKLDDALNSLAQSHSDDMAARGYISHTTPEGKTPTDRRKDLGIETLTGENVALSPTILYAHGGIMRSALHLENLLDSAWTRLGLGISIASNGQNKSSYYLSEEFSVRSLNETPLSSSEINQLKEDIVFEINKSRQMAGFGNLNRNKTVEPIIEDWLSDQSGSLQDSLQDTGIAKGSIFSTTAYYSPVLAESIGDSESFLSDSFNNISIGLEIVDEKIDFVFVLTP